MLINLRNSHKSSRRLRTNENNNNIKYKSSPHCAVDDIMRATQHKTILYRFFPINIMTFGGDLFYFITIFEISVEFSMARMTEIKLLFFFSVVRSINFHNGKCALVGLKHCFVSGNGGDGANSETEKWWRILNKQFLTWLSCTLCKLRSVPSGSDGSGRTAGMATIAEYETNYEFLNWINGTETLTVQKLFIPFYYFVGCVLDLCVWVRFLFDFFFFSTLYFFGWFHLISFYYYYYYFDHLVFPFVIGW